MRKVKREIVGAIILSLDNKVLLGKRKKNIGFDDLWVIPAGGVEEGETQDTALSREILEETGVDISKLEKEFVVGGRKAIVEKVLKSGEKVICEMNLSDYKVVFQKNSTDIPVKLDETEFAEIGWYSREQTKELNLAEPTRELLNKINFI